MPISKIRTGGLDVDNLEIGGTEAAKMPVGTTAQREGSPKKGDIRFNDTFDLMEYYTGNVWKSIDSPPTVTSISPTNFDATNDTITVTGTGFQSGAAVTCVGTNGASFACTTSFVSDTSVTFVPSSALVSNSGANDKYSIRVTNVSGLASADLSEALDFAPTPAFTTAAGSLGNIYDVERGTKTFTIAATSADSDDTLSFAVTAGSLPSNMSINSTSGVISGTPTALSAGASVTSTFTVTCTATGESTTKTNTRQFTITVKGKITFTFTYSAEALQDWTPPADLTLATTEMWGAGGGSYYSSSYANVSSQGGAGGFTKTTFNILPSERNQTWKIAVGDGGGSNATPGWGGGGNGQNGGGGGGGMAAIFSSAAALSAAPWTYVGTGHAYGTHSEPSSELAGKSGATHIVAIAGGGGGGGWYQNNNRHGAMGGGITGGQSTGSAGGSQTSGGDGGGNYDSPGGFLYGGYITNNASSGGSGGGGAGWYGGGTYQSSTGGDNYGGAGGSGFIGFADGSTSTVLTANENGHSYTDSTTRTNGTRTYTNSITRRSGNAVRTPPDVSSAYYTAGSGSVGHGYGSRDETGENGGNALVAIYY